ncbi:MAG: DUF1844 domain-containing protein [Gemmatimonadota bacterium]
MNPHFASLVVGLAHQAESALRGELPPGAAQQLGAGGAREVARTLIDTLAMLEEKTRGHLEPDEQQLLTGTLTSLRFAFVKAGSTH